MNTIKVLTPEDEYIIPEYLALFSRRLFDVESITPKLVIEKAKETYTQEYILENIRSGKERRFVGHFTNNTLDGLLIESADKLRIGAKVIDRVTMNWVMADISGRGVGSSLINNCVDRARKKKKDVVGLVVSPKNEKAISLYKRLNFKVNEVYPDGSLILMYNYLNRKLRPR